MNFDQMIPRALSFASAILLTNALYVPQTDQRTGCLVFGAMALLAALFDWED